MKILARVFCNVYIDLNMCAHLLWCRREREGRRQGAQGGREGRREGGRENDSLHARCLADSPASSATTRRFHFNNRGGLPSLDKRLPQLGHFDVRLPGLGGGGGGGGGKESFNESETGMNNSRTGSAHSKSSQGDLVLGQEVTKPRTRNTLATH